MSHASSFEYLKAIYGTKKGSLIPFLARLMDACTLLTDRDDIKRWTEHFSNLLNRIYLAEVSEVATATANTGASSRCQTERLLERTAFHRKCLSMEDTNLHEIRIAPNAGECTK